MFDRFGLLPADIRENYARADLIDRHLGVAQALSRAVKAIDERCSIVFISDRAEPRGDMIPGRWHIRRQNDGAVDSYIPIVTEDGCYREPMWTDVDRLRERDLWNGYRYKTGMEVEAEKIVANEREREAIRDEVQENFRAAKRVAGDGGLEKRKWGKG